MAKYLRFDKCKDGHFVVVNKGGNALGTISEKGEVFKRSPVFEIDGPWPTEFTSGCLRELADAIDSRFPKRKRSDSGAAPTTNKPQPEIPLYALEAILECAECDTAEKKLQSFRDLVAVHRASAA